MKNFQLALLSSLFSVLNVLAFSNSHEANNYLNKIIDTKISTEEIAEVDSSQALILEEELSNYLNSEIDASFIFSLDPTGRLTNLKTQELKNLSSEKFKTYVSKLSQFKSELIKNPTGTFGVWDAKYSCLLNKKMDLEENLFPASEMTNIDPGIFKQKRLCIKLLSPNLIEEPGVGEELRFSLEHDKQHYQLNLQIIGYDSRQIEFALKNLEHSTGKFKPPSLSFIYQKEHKEKYLQNIIDTSSSTIISSGLANAVFSHGISTGIAALVGISAAIKKSLENKNIFYLHAGDWITVSVNHVQSYGTTTNKRIEDA